jgi:gluconolactonase
MKGTITMKRFLFAAVLLMLSASTGSAQDIPLSKILIEGEPWQVVLSDRPDITYLDAGPKGLTIFQGRRSLLLRPDGKTEAAPPSEDPKTYETTLSRTGATYRIDAEHKAIIATTAKTATALKWVGPVKPTCLTLWPDDAQLVLGDAGDKFLWTARIEKDGSLSSLDRYYSLRVRRGETTSGVKAMTMDAGFLLYACTPLGVQVFDPTGRLCGVILKPAEDDLTAIALGGDKGDTLYVACGDKIYSRKIQGKAIYTLKKEK